MFDLLLDYAGTRVQLDELGADDFLEWLETMSGRHLDLYAFSTDWVQSGPQFALKAKGARGDLLIGWEPAQASKEVRVSRQRKVAYENSPDTTESGSCEPKAGSARPDAHSGSSEGLQSG